jgi:hypothetical protein
VKQVEMGAQRKTPHWAGLSIIWIYFKLNR